MPVQKRAAAPAQGSRARRQNHSCDQCRKSKRACDAICPDLSQRSPCSYCARTKKRCTMEWARSQAQSAPKVPRQRPHSERLSQDLLFPWKADWTQVETGAGTWTGLPEPSSVQELLTWEGANVHPPRSLLGIDSMPLSSMLDDNSGTQEETEMSDALTSAPSLSDPLLSDFFNASDISTRQPSDFELDPMCHQMWPTPQSSQASQSSQTCSSLSKSPRPLDNSSWMSSNLQSSPWKGPQTSLSPFSIDQQMIAASNYHQASASLFQVYHDVLEHNLSCWLTEKTCPYQRGSRSTIQVVPEWGSSWSNRIYQRTIKLDRAAQSCKLLQLTHSEDKAASKALHLAIMAFATQWAQGSHRHREKYPAGTPSHVEDELAHGVADEFDRILQHNIWEQAQRALQQAAGVESYRVACAELIFGLTQKPWNPDEQSPEPRMEAQGHRFATDTVLSRVREIIRKEGPPIYMESAARKMHALKYRYDAFEKGFGEQCGGRRQNGARDIAGMSSEDRAMIGLLYWWAIMFDTVSSSMNERPVVVLDEDCQHEAQKETQRAANMDKSHGQNRWNLDLFVQGSLEETHQTHWPCSYEAAAEDVIRSAPVKVLLFRHLSYLQNAVRKGAHEEQIEDIICSTISLYQYWNKTHGAFFGELVQNYNAVPQRIQGWFVCISAHWHLAALMFADLLEFVDESGLGMEDATRSRVTSQIAKRIRKHSVRELADLARNATPPTRDANLGVPQMPDFHHAVNEGTLLTEPWTMILIRAFTKACVIFLSETDESLRYAGAILGHSSHDSERSMELAEDCIKGLWLLGKKSDMARKIAETLSLALEKLRNECVV